MPDGTLTCADSRSGHASWGGCHNWTARHFGSRLRFPVLRFTANPDLVGLSMGFVALIPVGTPCIPVLAEKFPATLDSLNPAILQDGADTYAVDRVCFSFGFVIFTVSEPSLICTHRRDDI
ncbi:hypothetical protein BJ912DRAFT_988765 [Pholiota molesta]|nr:hypothetical protein BJ912DRAFT_988765 [Pholiota molesta]